MPKAQKNNSIFSHKLSLQLRELRNIQKLEVDQIHKHTMCALNEMGFNKQQSKQASKNFVLKHKK